jgi:protein YIPF1/2
MEADSVTLNLGVPDADMEFQDVVSLESSPQYENSGLLQSSSNNFGHEATSHGSPPPLANGGLGMPASAPAGQSPAAQGWLACCSIEYYKRYFQVDTVSVRDRIIKSMIPFGTPMYAEPTESPDLYGPFWIATTLIFLVAALGNLADYLYHCNKAGSAATDCGWEADIGKITLAATALYSCITIVPFIVSFLLVRIGQEKSYLEVVSIYGYSLFPFVPASVLCVADFNWFRWLSILLGFAISATFLLRNVWKFFEISQENKQMGYVLLGGMLAVHGGWAVLMKEYFFTYT